MKINYKDVCVVTTCPFCGHSHEVEVNEADYWDWEDGALVQDAFPYLSADERELLVSGICPDCWAKTFGGSEEEDPEEFLDLESEFDPYLGCYTEDC